MFFVAAVAPKPANLLIGSASEFTLSDIADGFTGAASGADLNGLFRGG